MRTTEIELRVLRAELAKFGRHGLSKAEEFAERFVSVKCKHEGEYGWICVQWGADCELIVSWEPRYREDELPSVILAYAPYNREVTRGQNLADADARGVAAWIRSALESSAMVWLMCEPGEAETADRIVAARWLPAPSGESVAAPTSASAPSRAGAKPLVLCTLAAGQTIYEAGEVIPWQGANMADLCAQGRARRLTSEEELATVACDCGREFLASARLRAHIAQMHRAAKMKGTAEQPTDRS